MIRRGENPEGNPDVNKYLGKHGDGWRGVLVAVSPSGREAILDVGGGKLILVRELGGPNQYPTEIDYVARVPPGWTN